MLKSVVLRMVVSWFASAAGALALLSSVAIAAPIDVIAADPGVLLPSNNSATLLTFENVPIGSLPFFQFDSGGPNGEVTITGAVAIENTSVTGKFAQPAGISGNFLTVSLDAAAGSVRFLFSVPENYFGLYWGSLDPYNSIAFRNGNTDVGSFSGSEVALLTGLITDGSWVAASSNRYINFYTGTNFFDEVVLSTTNFGFELANPAFGDPPTEVPEPCSLLLLASCLSGLAWASRRRRKNAGCRSAYQPSSGIGGVRRAAI